MNTYYQTTGTHSPQRINRTSYAIRVVLFFIGAFGASVLMSTSIHILFPVGIILTAGGAALLLLLFIGLFRWVLIPRLHDIGLEPAWAWSLIFFIHSLNFLFLLALLVVPTNAFAKRSYYA
jgi:uncharacterized membrane protein YhaH (DUF805 family)